MKFILLTLLMSLPSFPVPESLYNMPPDRAYMGFVSGKYLDWHLKNFQFPVLTSLERELLSHLNHWTLPGEEARSQLMLCHREDKGNGVLQKFRLWITPELRKKSEFTSAGKGFVPEFYERSSDGTICLINEDAWCRKSGQSRWVLDHRETVVKGHMTWENPFPLLSEDEVRYSDAQGNVTAIAYHRAISHVTSVPRSLLMVVRGHSLDTAFGLDRYIVEKDGTLTVCYP